ncbi:MAG: YerC/YecD family TrpR-related protein [Candidatus Peribacteraceae bacterium]|nr:YerC/YecD family TrpR-related protein [Candidatus Peribacteraceae bacterium]
MGKRRFSEGTWKKEPWFRALCRALGSLKTDEAIASFLRDVGTLSELQAWSERLEVARQLTGGKSYRAVALDTGASTATVTRVAKFLESGSGYRSVLGVRQGHHRHSSTIRGERMASKK